MPYVLTPRYIILAIVGLTPACSEVQQYQPSPGEFALSAPSLPQRYRLAVGDKVRITVFNEPDLSGEFQIAPDQTIAFPLIGHIDVTGASADELARRITAQLSGGYLNNPIVTAEVSQFRPFYVLGEVNHPGEYPYTSSLTVLQAVAAAEGFTYRANKRVVLLKRADSESEVAVNITSDLHVFPGDTLRIKERYF